VEEVVVGAEPPRRSKRVEEVSAEPLHCTKHVEVAVVDAETPHCTNQDICNR
jgi:hypothetical protein